jgi:hypothetical protein
MHVSPESDSRAGTSTGHVRDTVRQRFENEKGSDFARPRENQENVEVPKKGGPIPIHSVRCGRQAKLCGGPEYAGTLHGVIREDSIQGARRHIRD